MGIENKLSLQQLRKRAKDLGHFSNSLDIRTGYADLIRLKEASRRFRISEERLMTLVQEGDAPCVIIDGIYLFHSRDLYDWIRTNLVTIQIGRSLPVSIKLREHKKANPYGLPSELASIADSLKEFTADLIGPVIYILLLDSRIQYVGQTGNLTSRLNQHANLKAFDRVVYLPVPSEVLSQVEEALISFLQPPLNLNGKYTINEKHKEALEGIGLMRGFRKNQLVPVPATKISPDIEECNECSEKNGL